MKRASMVAMVLLVANLMGCAPRSDYDQLWTLNKTLESEKLAADQAAKDAEEQANALRNQLRGMQQDLETQRRLADNLKAENTRLDQAFKNAQDLMNRIPMEPQAPVIVSSPLPPALDSALRNFAASHPNAVEYDPARGAVKWKSDLLFASGSDVLRSDVKSTLRSFGDVVNTPNAVAFDIIVVGHTDNDPIKHAMNRGHLTNWHLSAHRAISVAAELKGYIDPQRIGVMGYGEYRPVAPNDTKENKTLNRRVEILLLSHSPQMARHIDTAQPMPMEPQK